MQNEIDSPDEWDEEEPYYDWDDAETTATGGTPVAPAGGAALVAAHCHC